MKLKTHAFNASRPRSWDTTSQPRGSRAHSTMRLTPCQGTPDPQPNELLAERDLNNAEALTTLELRAITTAHRENLRLQDLRSIAEKDQEYQKLKHYIHNGFPNHHQDLPDECKRYWSVRTHLLIEDDLIVYSCRLLIPTEMCREALTQLHNSHQGIVRTKERARLTLYWPGMDNDIKMPARPAKIHYHPTHENRSL